LPPNLATSLRGRKRPVRIRTFHLVFCAVAGAFLPEANAQQQLLTYFNFNSEINGQPPPYISQGPQIITLVNDAINPFPAGSLSINSTAGTLVNRVGTDPAGGALDARGNTNGTSSQFCFGMGPINTTGIGELQQISLSFALQSQSNNNSQFTTLTLNYSTNGITYTQFAQFTNLRSFTTFTALSANLPVAANNQPTLFIQFCFTGSTTNAAGNHTYLDNIQINAIVPEPATTVGGVLGAVGLCWSQRRRLIRSLRWRRA
jgi:hypothetical protein